MRDFGRISLTCPAPPFRESQRFVPGHILERETGLPPPHNQYIRKRDLHGCRLP